MGIETVKMCSITEEKAEKKVIKRQAENPCVGGSTPPLTTHFSQQI